MTVTVSLSKRMSMVVHGNGSSNKSAVVTSSHGGSHASSSRLTNPEAATAGGLAASTGPPSPTKLRGVTEIELGAWKKAMKDSRRLNYAFDDLDESIDYPFKNHDSVWILSGDDNWYLGRIAGKSIRVGQTRQSQKGFYYPVCYGKRMNLRKYCSPLNGDMKPDTKDFRDLLRKSGLLDDEDEDEDMSDSTNSGSSYSNSF